MPVENVKFNVVSFFDGISCAQQVLKEIEIDIDMYYSFEIDNKAIEITQNNFPNTIQLGDVTLITENLLSTLPKIDFVFAGFPCQDISVAGKQEGLKGKRSGLFYNFNESLEWLLKNNNPDIQFLVENVGGLTKDDRTKIEDCLGVKGIFLDSAMFSAQRRKRWYWTNIEQNKAYSECDDVLNDILENKRRIEFKTPEKMTKVYSLLSEGQNWRKLPLNNEERIKIEEARQRYRDRGKQVGGESGSWKLHSKKEKSITLTSTGIKQKLTRFVFKDNFGDIRYPTPIECERLQGLPDNYTKGLKTNERYKLIGNGWNIPTIKHLLKNINTNG